jgi:hypothetical protein
MTKISNFFIRHPLLRLTTFKNEKKEKEVFEQKERKEKSPQGKKTLPAFTLQGLPGKRKPVSAIFSSVLPAKGQARKRLPKRAYHFRMPLVMQINTRMSYNA